MSFYTLVRDKIKTDFLEKIHEKSSQWRTIITDETTEAILRTVVSEKDLVAYSIKDIQRIDNPKRVPSSDVRPVFFLVPDDKTFLKVAIDCGYKIGSPITRQKATSAVIPQKEPLDDTPAPQLEEKNDSIDFQPQPQQQTAKKSCCGGGDKNQAAESAAVVTPAIDNKNSVQKTQQQQKQPVALPYYNNIIIYTTTPVNEDTFAELKDKYGLISICSMFVELNLQFTSYCSGYFSCYFPNSIYTNWRLCSPGSGVDPARFSIEKYINHVSEGIVSMACACSCGMPLIWSSNKGLQRELSSNLVVSRVAKKVYQRLEEIRISNRLLSNVGEVLDKGVSPMGFKDCRLHIILLDRGYDLLSPIVHQKTYEAFLTDVFKLNNQELGGKYGLTAEVYFRTVNYKDPTKPVRPFDYNEWKRGNLKGPNASFLQLDDSDSIFRKMRHNDIDEVRKQLPKDFEEFKQKNKLLEFKANVDSDKKVSYDDMRLAMASKFEYEEKINLYSGHITLTHCAMLHAKEHLFIDIASLEDALLSGINEEDDHGRIRKIHMPLDMLCEKLSAILSGVGLLSEDKVRLLILSYALRNDLLTDSVAASLKEVAQLSEYEQDVIDNMNALSDNGITIEKDVQNNNSNNNVNMIETAETNGQKSSKKSLKKRLKSLFGATREPEEVYKSFERKETPLKEIMQSCEKGKLGTGFDLVNPKWFKQENDMEKADPNTSMVQWMDYIPTQFEVNNFITGNTAPEVEIEKNNTNKLSEAHKVVFFIVGGATVSEMREVAEMNNEIRGKKVGAGSNTFQYYIGSDSIISPNKFIEEVACLSTPYPTFAENRAHDPTFSGKL